MGWMQKGDNDILTLQIKCSGPIEGLTVTADARAHVKGYADNPVVMLPPNKDGKLDVGKALDMGVMSVIKDIGMKEPYVGQTHLVSGEIAEDRPIILPHPNRSIPVWPLVYSWKRIIR